MASWRERYDRSTRAEQARLASGEGRPTAFTREWWVLAVVAAVVGGVGAWVRTGADEPLVVIPIMAVVVFALAVGISWVLRRSGSNGRGSA